MKKVFLSISLVFAWLGSAYAQESADVVFADDSIVAATDTIDPYAEAIEEDVQKSSDETTPQIEIDTYEDNNDTVLRKLAIHPLRKGSYFQLGVGAGVSGLTYKVEGGQLGILPSLTANIGYTYFFVPTFGLGTGAYISQYGAVTTLTGEFGKNITSWNGVTDSDGDTYNHRTRMEYWKERQVAYMVEIPLAFHFQQNLGYRTGFYAQLGAKFGLPIYSDYKVIGGSMRHVGEYKEYNWDIFGERENAHGFGLEENNGQSASVKGLPNDSNLQYQYSVNAFLEMGALFQVSNRVDLFLGIYANYGFRNIDPYKGKEKEDIGFRIDDTAEGHGFMNDYNGLLATKQAEGCGIPLNTTGSGKTSKGINPFSVGVKFGINIYAGKTANKTKDKKGNGEQQIIYVHDTIRIQDTIRILDTIMISDTIVMRDTLQMLRPDVLEEEEQEQEQVQEQEVPHVPVTRQDTLIQVAQTLEEELRKSVIFFDFDKYDPKLEPADILDKVAAVLVQHPDMGIEVNGHACKTGTDEYNQQLSMKRARAVANMLRDKGVKDSQMKVQSFGSTKPFRYNDFEHQKSKDRRVEIIPVGYVDQETQQQQATEAEEASHTDEGVVNKTTREIPLIEIDGKMVPIFLKYTEFIGEVTMKRGMYLAQLSRQWYGGEQAFWVYIYEANMFQIQDPSDIEPGTILMIPKLDPSVIDKNNPECIRKANELKEKYLLK